MLKGAEVAIIGAGLAGLSCAYFCAKAGLPDIVVLEQDGIFSKASGGNSGGVCLGSNPLDKPGVKMLGERGLQTIRSFAIEENVDLESKEASLLILFWSEDEAERAKRRVRREQEAGYAVSLLEQKELRQVEPELSQLPLGAICYPQATQINPFKLAGAFYKRSRQMGVKILHFTKVKGFDHKGDRITTILTDQGEMSVSVVVNAAGAWASELGDLMGVDIPITPVKGQLLVTERLPQIIRNLILTQVAVTQFPDGSVISGGTKEQVGFDTRVSHDIVKFICEETILLFPKLSKASVLRAWAALRALSPDILPIIGEVPPLKSAYVIAGLYTPGILFAPIAGRLVAELIAKNIRDPLLDSFAPSRFMSGKRRDKTSPFSSKE